MNRPGQPARQSLSARKKKKMSKKEEKQLVKKIKAKLKNGEDLDTDEEEFAFEKDLL